MFTEHKLTRRVGIGLGTVMKSLVAAVSGWIAYSALRIKHDEPLPKAIDAPRNTAVSDETGLVSWYEDTTAPQGRPLVLIHSVNAAASAYEMRPLFNHYRGQRPVYAIDLPGFGFSDRADRVYSQPLYTRAIIDLLERIGQPADVVALSLGCEFAAHAAQERPALFHSLTMISPSGLTSPREKRASQQASDSGSSDGLYKLFSFPLWGRAFYDLIATRRSIRYFLEKSFEGPVDPNLIRYDYATSHQPGAHHAPLYFVSGKLFTRDVLQKVYERLTLPVLVIYDRDSFVRFDELPRLLERPNWRAARITPTRGLPQFEMLAETVRALDDFWSAGA